MYLRQYAFDMMIYYDRAKESVLSSIYRWSDINYKIEFGP